MKSGEFESTYQRILTAIVKRERQNRQPEAVQLHRAVKTKAQREKRQKDRELQLGDTQAGLLQFKPAGEVTRAAVQKAEELKR